MAKRGRPQTPLLRDRHLRLLILARIVLTRAPNYRGRKRTLFLALARQSLLTERLPRLNETSGVAIRRRWRRIDPYAYMAAEVDLLAARIGTQYEAPGDRARLAVLEDYFADREVPTADSEALWPTTPGQLDIEARVALYKKTKWQVAPHVVAFREAKGGRARLQSRLATLEQKYQRFLRSDRATLDRLARKHIARPSRWFLDPELLPAT